jgi:hypothetical protein
MKDVSRRQSRDDARQTYLLTHLDWHTSGDISDQLGCISLVKLVSDTIAFLQRPQACVVLDRSWVRLDRIASVAFALSSPA